MNGIPKGAIGLVAGAAAVFVPAQIGALDFLITTPEKPACVAQPVGSLVVQHEVFATPCVEPKHDTEQTGPIHSRRDIEKALMPLAAFLGGVLGATRKSNRRETAPQNTEEVPNTEGIHD